MDIEQQTVIVRRIPAERRELRLWRYELVELSAEDLARCVVQKLLQAGFQFKPEFMNVIPRRLDMLRFMLEPKVEIIEDFYTDWWIIRQWTEERYEIVSDAIPRFTPSDPLGQRAVDRAPLPLVPEKKEPPRERPEIEFNDADDPVSTSKPTPVNFPSLDL